MPRTTSRPTPNMTEVDPDYLLGTFNAKQEFELNEQIAHGTGLNSRDPIAIYKQDIVVPFEGHMGMIALTVPQGSQPVSRDACRALREVTVEQDVLGPISWPLNYGFLSAPCYDRWYLGRHTQPALPIPPMQVVASKTFFEHRHKLSELPNLRLYPARPSLSSKQDCQLQRLKKLEQEFMKEVRKWASSRIETARTMDYITEFQEFYFTKEFNLLNLHSSSRWISVSERLRIQALLRIAEIFYRILKDSNDEWLESNGYENETSLRSTQMSEAEHSSALEQEMLNIMTSPDLPSSELRAHLLDWDGMREFVTLLESKVGQLAKKYYAPIVELMFGVHFAHLAHRALDTVYR